MRSRRFRAPRRREGKIIEFLVDFARRHNIEYKKDAIGNVVMRKPATPGYETHRGVILQSHMDMVCEKNSDVEFDFEHDAIRPRIDGDWVRAEGTTLGADCGIGMAPALAVLLDPDVQHGPLEALFTVDEETGLTGAFELGEGCLRANTSSTSTRRTRASCSSAAPGVSTRLRRSTARWSPRRRTTPSSGWMFRTCRAATRATTSTRAASTRTRRWLGCCGTGCSRASLRLSYFNGGNLRNAIPREAYAIFGVPARLKDDFVKRYRLFAADLEAEFRFREPNFKITLNEMPEVEGGARRADAVRTGLLAGGRAQQGSFHVVCGSGAGGDLDEPRLGEVRGAATGSW